MDEHSARQLSGLQLAYMGDAIHELMVRTRLVQTGCSVHDMTRKATSKVRAGAQAQAAARVADILSEDEADILRRGRNAHARHHAPKGANPAEYAQATGLEALLGYLYLTGRMARAWELFDWIERQQPEGSVRP